MSRLNPENFISFFQEMYHCDPFPWQARLARRVLEDDWPSVIALPTASGKTAVIDIAVFALACQSGSPAWHRTAARRIFFVVDRRVIVDEAFERSRKLAEKLYLSKNGVVKSVADRLRKLSGGDEPLACFQLRGGIYRDDKWARSPVHPTVIASTVDQIGSRLLFRGYGLRSGYLSPIHAALAANDSLIILDEAHCANPFMETLEYLSKYRELAEQKLLSPFRIISMSATPKKLKSSKIFYAENEDWQNETLGRRLKAKKPTRLALVKSSGPNPAAGLIASQLGKEALALAENSSIKAIAIIANRIATAKQVFSVLRERAPGDVTLLIGRMRPIDRDQIMAEWLPRLGSSSSEDRVLQKPAFIVATQCIEVGADIDFDGMVTECASLDALRQRFGRLNRMGRQIDARGVIVAAENQVNTTSDEDPIYGTAINTTAKLHSLYFLAIAIRFLRCEV